ncbi:hypothetical protein [Solimonas marina]|uniref:Uncharacterized protein n=1 Tax=Solimonas marina TaxID=2714601 RepID=A0A969WBE4_9GAMM|nr:hypothetical protein [Solimonas marina]NKF23429.1 hypothetical protein [Solimonas marina]
MFNTTYSAPIFSAAVAAIMTVSTFGSLTTYVGQVPTQTKAGFVQSVASRQIDSHLQLALQNSQTQVRDNIAGNVSLLMPQINTETPALMVAQR